MTDARSQLAAVSVDLDPLAHYCHIHGLPSEILSDDARQLIRTRALPRLRQLFSAGGIPSTLFAIGEEVERDAQTAQALREAHAAGHEIASHSHRHDYALSRRTEAEITADLARAQEVLTRAIGRAPEGFRAPGYTLSPALYRAIETIGFTYASSAFPAAPYWLGKAAVMGLLRLKGQRSRAILDTPRVLAAPRAPYRPDPDAPYRRGQGRVIELPVTVTPGLRFPVIGTFVATLPAPVVRRLVHACRGLRLFNLELHAVDVLDASDGLPDELVRRQRDLAVPWTLKAERLEAVIRHLARERDVVTLGAAAAAFRMV